MIVAVMVAPVVASCAEITRVPGAVVAVTAGSADRVAELVQPLKDLRPEVDLIQPMPYLTFQQMLDPSAPKGHRNYWRGEYLNRLSTEAIDTFVAHAPTVAAAGMPFSQMTIFRIGQAVTAVPDGATAFSHREASYLSTQSRSGNTPPTMSG
jgi:hypothetical protein